MTRELRVRELAEALGLPAWTVRRLLALGKIPGATRYPRGHWRLPAERLPDARKALREAGYAV